MSITELDTGASYDVRYDGSWKDSLLRWYNTTHDGRAFTSVDIVQQDTDAGKLRVRLTAPSGPGTDARESEELSLSFPGSLPPLPDETNL